MTARSGPPAVRDDLVLVALLAGPADVVQLDSIVALHPDPARNYQEVRNSLRRLRAKGLVSRRGFTQPAHGSKHYILRMTDAGRTRAKRLAGKPRQAGPPLRLRVLSALSQASLTLEGVCEALGSPYVGTHAALRGLRDKGLVASLPGDAYALTKAGRAELARYKG